MKSYVRRAIEQAALVSISMSALAGCGDSTTGDSTSDAATGNDAATSANAWDATTSDGAATAGQDAATAGSNDAAPEDFDSYVPPNTTCGNLVPVQRDAGVGQICGASYAVSASAPGCDPSAGAISSAQCDSLCPPGGQDGGVAPIQCFLESASDPNGDAGDGGNLYVDCIYANCASGRRPEGFVARRGSRAAGSPVGDFLATVTRLEAASVFAFRTMTRELSAFGAPRRLTLRSRRSAREEVRHARSMKKLAHRAGAEVLPVVVPPPEPRSLEAMAIENAVEGCVRETFGAALAELQATRALDPSVRKTLRKIAKDEAEHAQLSWRVARWINRQLDSEARARVEAHRRAAIAELEAQVSLAPDATLVREMGLPLPHEAKAMLRSLQTSLWAA